MRFAPKGNITMYFKGITNLKGGNKSNVPEREYALFCLELTWQHPVLNEKDLSCDTNEAV